MVGGGRVGGVMVGGGAVVVGVVDARQSGLGEGLRGGEHLANRPGD